VTRANATKVKNASPESLQVAAKRNSDPASILNQARTGAHAVWWSSRPHAAIPLSNFLGDLTIDYIFQSSARLLLRQRLDS